MLDEYWEKEQVKEKFVEFEEIMKARSESKELVYKLLFGWSLKRISNSSDYITYIISYSLYPSQAFLATVNGGVIMGWFYINNANLEDNKRFDCLLPEAYWYESPSQNQTLKTTYCYVLPVGAFNLVCNLLFGFYCLVFLLQIILSVQNIRNCLRDFKLIEYMPIDGYESLKDKTLCDLHILMGLISENNTSRSVRYATEA